jgi:dienelactone hydrolase
MLNEIIHSLKRTVLCALVVSTVLPATSQTATGDSQQTGITNQASQQRRGGRFGGGERGVYRSRVAPQWFANETKFWYRNDLAGGTKEFILVDAEKGLRQTAFDHQKVAVSLSKAAGEEFKGDRLPFSDIEFVEDGKAIVFSASGKNWKCNLGSYECTPSATGPTVSSASNENEQAAGRRRGGGGGGRAGGRTSDSPDGKWTAVIKDQNVFIRGKSEAEGSEAPLTKDGQEGGAYGRLEWSPDSKVLTAWKTTPGDRKEVYLVQSSPSGGGRAVMTSRPYTLPGDKFTTYEISVFDVAGKKQIKPDIEQYEHEWTPPSIRWSLDGKKFYYNKVDRGHQRYRIIEVDAETGATRNIVDEKSKTFIWTAHTENLRLQLVNWMEKSDEVIYVSEMDGWRHLYLVDAKDAKLKQITKGEWVIRGIDRIDEEKRQIWFTASGKDADQDPYFIHNYRVNFDGTGLVALTAGNGTHTVQFSPSRKYLIDTYSRVDMAPANDLRRVSDGSLVCKLEEADVTEMKANGWAPPEVFVSKARDGKTDIWGIIVRPRNFDPNKKYPIIEDIYAGPQGSFVPKPFGGNRYQALTELGFIVVKIDGMGTANRSKAFHDVCFKNLKDAGFPDRILWIKAAAAKYPHMDTDRVGVYGSSAGGQNAGGSVLFHPDFYKAAVAGCGCHDNRMDKASWNEQWMGYPVGPQYSESSNIDNAAKLKGKLLLIVGEMDSNVPPESTMRYADALIKANKDFDLVVVPGAGHGMGGAYGNRRLQDFFVRHLLGKEPPDRNNGETSTQSGG